MGVGPHEGLALIGPSDLAFWWYSSLFLPQSRGGDDGAGAAPESARVLSRDALGLCALAEAVSFAMRWWKLSNPGERLLCFRATGRLWSG